MTPRTTYLPSITPYLGLRLRYKACASKYEPLLPCTECMTRLKQFVYRCQIYDTL